MKNAQMMRNSFLALWFLIVVGCRQDQQQEGETLFRGSARIVCDQELASLILPQLDSFALQHEGAYIEHDTLPALDAMQQLLTGRARAAIIARDYLPEEDSLLRANAIEKHRRFLIATDALVFVVSAKSSLDTISEDIVRSALQGQRSWPLQYRWAIPDRRSSLSAHLRMIAGGVLRLPAVQASTGEHAITLVEKGRADVAVALLSQYLRFKAYNPSLRTLRTVVRDTGTGDRIAVSPHAATVVKGTYPYCVPIYGYLLDTARNFPYGVIASIAQEPRPQRAMLNAGIVPGYAKIHLVVPDEQ
jgi:hypothetical protein